jgi:hypothetical protein
MLLSLRIFAILGFLVATVGSRLQIIPGSQEMHTAANAMFEAGAILSGVIVLSFAAMLSKFWSARDTLSGSSQKVSGAGTSVVSERLIVKQLVVGMAATIVFYVVRVVWFCLAAFSTAGTWDQIFGSLGAFIAMALLPEYVILAVHVYLGFAIPKIPKPTRVAPNDQTEETSANNRNSRRRIGAFR